MPQDDYGQPIGVDVPGHKPPSVATLRTEMTGRFCRLVPLDAAAHAAELFAAYRTAPDGRDWTYLPYGPFEDESEFGAWLATMAKLDDPIFFSVIDQRTNEAAGLTSYLRINPTAASIEVGHIHFSRVVQRTPVATEAMYLMMQKVFTDTWRRYEWKCDALNNPSRAAAARFGFRFEGIFRQATMYKGRNRDTAWFGIVDGEWPSIDAAYSRWLDPANFDGDGSQRTSLQAHRDSRHG